MSFDLNLVELKCHPNKKIQKIISNYSFDNISSKEFKKKMTSTLKSKDIMNNVSMMIEKNIDIFSLYIESFKVAGDVSLIEEEQKKYKSMLKIIDTIEEKDLSKKKIFGLF